MLTPDQTVARLQSIITDMEAPPSVRLNIGDSLPNAILNAPAGTLFLLPLGFAHVGDYTIPKPCMITTDAPAPLARVLPSDPLASLQGAIVNGAPDIWLTNLAMKGLVPASTLLTTGLRSKLDRVSFVGTPQGQHRAIAANSQGVTIRRSLTASIFSADQDAQAIGCWDGTADLLVDDCGLEASGENVIAGGQDPLTAAGQPTNITIQNCLLSKPLAWRGMPIAGDRVKNLLELKNAVGVKVVNCELDYVWVSGQTGFAVLMTVRDQDGTAPTSTVEHVLFQGNKINHMGSAVQILGLDDTIGDLSTRMSDIVFRGNVFADIDPGLWGGSGYQFWIGGGPDQLVLDGNDFEGKNLNSFLSFGAPPTATPLPTTGLVLTNNRFQEGDYGIHGDGAPGLGKVALDMYAPGGYVSSGNTIVKGPSGRVIVYPAGMTLVNA